MAKRDELPGFKEKREILFGKKSNPQKMRDTGIKFMQAERYDDALEFFAQAKADDLAREIADVALQNGDAPLYMRAKKVLAETITQEQWDTLALNALRQDSPSKAYLARLKGGRQEEAERLKTQMEGTEAQGPEEPSGEATSEDPSPG